MDRKQQDQTRFERWADRFALNRTVIVVLMTVLFFGLGEQLWESFMPAYLEARTDQVAREAVAVGGELSWQALTVIGVYSCLRDLFGGGWYIRGRPGTG